jgi:hypothetical protein
MTGVVGGTVTNNNTDVGVSISTNVTWTFAHAINQDDVTSDNFKVYRTSDNSIVSGNLTIDDTKKIVTFIPTSIESGIAYTAEAKAVDLLDGSATTTALTVNFTTL